MSARFDEFFRIRAVVGVDADPDGSGDVQLVVRDLVRRDERGDDLLRAGGRVVRVLDLRQQHHELVTAETADRIRAPDARQQAPRHGLQQGVANHMAQAVVHVLEPIQIEEQHGQAMAMAAGQGNRLGEPVVEQHAVGQVGQKVVLGQIDGPQRHRPHLAHVLEHDHRADHLPSPIVDRRRGVFDRRLEPVASDEEAGRRQIDGPIELHRPVRRVPRRFAGCRIEDREHFRELPAQRLLARPARHAFGHEIEVGHDTVDIGAEHGVADRVEGRFRALLFKEQRFVRRLALDDVADGPRQRRAGEVSLEDTILGAALDGLSGDILIVWRADDQNRHVGRRPPDLFEGREALAVWKVQVEENGRNAIPAQPLEAFRKQRRAFKCEDTFLFVGERPLHRRGIGRILSDQKNTPQFAVHVLCLSADRTPGCSPGT